MPFLIAPSLGPAELLIILAIVVVLFGATRIGDIGKGIGRGIREFRREVREGQEETEEKGQPTEPAEEATGEEAKSYAAKAESSEEKSRYIQH